MMLIISAGPYHTQVLKSIVYAFDGVDLNATSIPEGEYSYGDLSYQVAANPLAANDMVGDRCMKLNLNWSAGYAAFGRGISRYIEFNPAQDYFNFYFYNPASNNQNAMMEVTIADDDNQNNTYETASDDQWKKTLSIPVGSGWQLISVPLSGFTDGNSGGNGIFDVAFTQNQGMLLLVEFRFSKPSTTAINAQFYLDMICFTDGTMPTGNSILDLPPADPGDYCLLGAHQPESGGNNQLIPVHVEGLFPVVSGHKLKYVNTYLQWSQNSSLVPNAFPGASIQTLLNNGYRPIITWEPMFLSLAPLDPQQPNLTKIINGDYNTYIDNFADVMKNYTDTVIIRFMHEFEGDWYPWCVSQNGGDPSKFALAFQKVVDRFKNKGATKVKWMWCGNSDYAPYQSYNWMVNAYPGNNYVDYVATDIYNGHFPLNLPWWRSFRWQATESCYYLRKYFPNKPLIICELGCRERISGDDPTSESKAGWFERMDKELQSNFRKVRGLIFFNANTGPSQNWYLNSSTSAVESVRDNIWYDNYYFNIPSIPQHINEQDKQGSFYFYPNPASDHINLHLEHLRASGITEVYIYDASGAVVARAKIDASGENEQDMQVHGLSPGIYFVRLRPGAETSHPAESAGFQSKLIVK
jgi:beta-mannanase